MQFSQQAEQSDATELQHNSDDNAEDPVVAPRRDLTITFKGLLVLLSSSRGQLCLEPDRLLTSINKKER